ncbi:tripartite motif-containing protein 16-like protein [Erpetoichthys calabaricus]|uniref:tripartite motif-containing protein 16-like protein n=1 Tax=Erpetoichthys calabaricus TaxID=27687 RepID=UPI0010A032CB|nr:tripartite motif-containing protein 16-like protein [Erpetoichthys calabaricus]
MAEALSSLSMSQYSCSLCLEVLKEPATLPCGHNYCLECINKHWDRLDIKGTCKCPQCEMEFHPRPQLYKNTTLSDLIENIKEHTVRRTPSKRKRKASMTNMASNSESHLQHPGESATSKRRKLEESTGNLKENFCTKHQRVLEMFCRTDKMFVCSECVATEHSYHDTKTLNEERAERKSQLESTTKEVKKRLQDKIKRVEKLKETSARIKISAEEEVQEHQKTFKSAIQFIERLKLIVIDMIRDQKRKKLRKDEELIKRLEKEIRELKKRDTELAELSQTDNHIHFLKKLPSLSLPPEDDSSPEVAGNGDFLPDSKRKKLTVLKERLEEIGSLGFVKTSKTGAVVSGDVLKNLRSRSNFLKYFQPLTLDPNTAHKHLHLSERKKKVTQEEKESRYHDHPDRFDYWQQVLCREELRGTCFYWEVEWSGKNVEIGVTYKGISRKGVGDECVLGFNDKSWNLSCSYCSCSAWHNKKETQINAPFCHRIGVFLDYSAGSLSFYSVSDSMTLLHRFSASFTESLYPAFRLGSESFVAICLPNQSSFYHL